MMNNHSINYAKHNTLVTGVSFLRNLVGSIATRPSPPLTSPHLSSLLSLTFHTSVTDLFTLPKRGRLSGSDNASNVVGSTDGPGGNRRL